MRGYDLTPFFRPATTFNGSAFDSLFRAFPAERETRSRNTYPSYNFAKTGENTFRLTLVVAGYNRDDLDISVDDGVLAIAGKPSADGDDVTYLRRGFAAPAFERRFTLHEDIEVGDARLENGLLHIDLEHQVPEHRKPRRIAIGSESQQAA